MGVGYWGLGSGDWLMGVGDWFPRLRDALTRGLVIGEVFTHVPHSRDASPHGRDALTRAYARIRDWLLGSGD